MANDDKDWRPGYRKTVTEATGEVGWTAGKVVCVIIVLMVAGTVLGIIGSGLGWFGEAATVAREEFGPRAALQKYEWFIDRANAIEKMDQDVKMFEERGANVEKQYEGYGADKSKWAPDVRLQYNSARQQGRDDLLAVASQRNNLVREYNAASDKFNWSPFQTRPDKPKERFHEYAVK